MNAEVAERTSWKLQGAVFLKPWGWGPVPRGLLRQLEFKQHHTLLTLGRLPNEGGAQRSWGASSACLLHRCDIPRLLAQP